MRNLISCIMPTCNREWCLPYAIAQFQAQTYAHKELIVLDNGSRSIEHLVPKTKGIHYHRATCSGTGLLRNEAIGHAKGDIIVHWDDDDMHHPEQLSYFAGFMGRIGANVVGADEAIYHDIRSGENWKMVYGGMEHWVHGSTLMYRREVWDRMPFHGHRTEDMFWLRDIIELGIIPRPGYRWPVQVNLMHDDNVHPKVTTKPVYSRIDELPVWTQRKEYREMLEAARKHAEMITSKVKNR